jgi:GNAT superfamily N-acetyltransferase
VLAKRGVEVGARPTVEEELPWFEPGTETVSGACLAQRVWDPKLLLYSGGVAELAGIYKATMHIDLLEEYQGQGWGRQLIERFVASLREACRAQGKATSEVLGKGLHIVAGAENAKVVKFYEKCGFRLVEGGEKHGTIWMVRDVE